MSDESTVEYLLHKINNLPQIRTSLLILIILLNNLPTNIPPFQRLPMESAKQLSSSPFVTSTSIPSLKSVFLCERHVGDEEDEGV